MWLRNQSSSAARTPLVYITVGALIVIWTGVWYVHLFNNPPETNSVYYWCTGFLMTGLTLVLIGLGLGWIGRLAHPTDLPAAGVPIPAVIPQPTAAAPTPLVVPGTSTSAPVAVNGQPLIFPPQGPTDLVRGPQ